MSNDLIHEVEEAVRQEKLENFWKEYGTYIIAGAVMTVLFTGLFAGWRSWDERTNKAQTAELIKAGQNENPALALDNLSPQLRAGQRTVALFTAAGILVEQGSNGEALLQYRKLAKSNDVEPMFRELATLLAIKLEWNTAENAEDKEAENSKDLAVELLGQLGALTKNPSSPWFHHAHMQSAIIKAHAFENYKGAQDHLAVILTAETIPPSLKERALALSHVYGLKMAEAAKKKENEEPEG